MNTRVKFVESPKPQSSAVSVTFLPSARRFFASGGAYRVGIYLGFDSSLGADTGVYMKNGNSYTAYLNATNQTEREALADRTGQYRYRYDDGCDIAVNQNQLICDTIGDTN